MLLSALFVSFRDMQPIWDVMQQILFYASPVIISVVTVEEKFSRFWLHVYMLNPLAVAFQQFRHAMITHGTPSAGAVLGGWAHLVGPMLDRPRNVRAGLLGVQPIRPADRREPIGVRRTWAPVRGRERGGTTGRADPPRSASAA